MFNEMLLGYMCEENIYYRYFNRILCCAKNFIKENYETILGQKF